MRSFAGVAKETEGQPRHLCHPSEDEDEDGAPFLIGRPLVPTFFERYLNL
jgi:hypothetical protein